MDNDKEFAYRFCARKNMLSGLYCDMAMVNYYKALKIFDKSKNETNYSFIGKKDTFYGYIISTIIYSAICIEAFLNDYLAVCLGDNNFYDNFDRLPPQSKFHLISQLIFHDNIDKGIEPYQSISTLFKNRNELVHVKSKAVHGFSEDEVYEYIDNDEYYEQLDKQLDEKINIEPMEKDLRTAFYSLIAIKNIAEYFDKHDNMVFAVVKLFDPGYPNNFDISESYKKDILKKLGVEVKYEV